MDREFEIWDILDTEPTKEVKKIKRAYAKQVVLYHPEEYPEKFREVQCAYDEALNLAKNEETSICDNDLEKKRTQNNSYAYFGFQEEINEKVKFEEYLYVDEYDKGNVFNKNLNEDKKTCFNEKLIHDGKNHEETEKSFFIKEKVKRDKVYIEMAEKQLNKFDLMFKLNFNQINLKYYFNNEEYKKIRHKEYFYKGFCVLVEKHLNDIDLRCIYMIEKEWKDYGECRDLINTLDKGKKILWQGIREKVLPLCGIVMIGICIVLWKML